MAKTGFADRCIQAMQVLCTVSDFGVEKYK